MKLEEIKEAVEVIKAYRQMLTDSVSNQLGGDIEAFDMAIEAMEREQKTGHWIRQDNTKKPYYGWLFCSECDSVLGDKTRFCSNCGCRMVEPQESEET